MNEWLIDWVVGLDRTSFPHDNEKWLYSRNLQVHKSYTMCDRKKRGRRKQKEELGSFDFRTKKRGKQ